MPRKYKEFNSNFWKNICETKELDANCREDFEEIKTEIIKMAERYAEGGSYKINRKYGNKKVVFYFKICSKNQKYLDVMITAIYVNGCRIYDGYCIKAKFEL